MTIWTVWGMAASPLVPVWCGWLTGAWGRRRAWRLAGWWVALPVGVSVAIGVGTWWPALVVPVGWWAGWAVGRAVRPGRRRPQPVPVGDGSGPRVVPGPPPAWATRPAVVGESGPEMAAPLEWTQAERETPLPGLVCACGAPAQIVRGDGTTWCLPCDAAHPHGIDTGAAGGGQS